MITFNLKPDPIRVGWYTPDDMQRNNLEMIRWRIAMRPHSWRPPTDVYETEEAIVVRVEIAGMRRVRFFHLLWMNAACKLRGVRPDNSERRVYHQMEILFGEFSTEVELPYAVEAEQVEAVYRDGFLRIVLPKAVSRAVHIQDQETPNS